MKDILVSNPDNNSGGPNFYTSYSGANPGGVDQTRVIGTLLGYEDDFLGGDLSFDDVTVEITPM